jgi:hypothetical protein
VLDFRDRKGTSEQSKSNSHTSMSDSVISTTSACESMLLLDCRFARHCRRSHPAINPEELQLQRVHIPRGKTQSIGLANRTIKTLSFNSNCLPEATKQTDDAKIARDIPCSH